MSSITEQKWAHLVELGGKLQAKCQAALKAFLPEMLRTAAEILDDRAYVASRGGQRAVLSAMASGPFALLAGLRLLVPLIEAQRKHDALHGVSSNAVWEKVNWNPRAFCEALLEDVNPPGRKRTPYAQLFAQAQEEIARLRAALDEARAEAARLRAENQELRERLQQCKVRIRRLVSEDELAAI